MRDFISFLWAVASHWLVLMGGAAVITLLGIFERLRGKDISVRLYIVLMLLAVFYASFLAWVGQRENTGSVQRELQESRTRYAALQAEKAKLDEVVEGKDRRIQELSDKLQDAIRTRPVEVKVESSAPVREPALTEDLRVSQRRIPSPREYAPFAVELTVQVNVPSSQWAFLSPATGRLPTAGFSSSDKPCKRWRDGAWSDPQRTSFT
ncbi:MAG: hypothetical protein HYY45_17195 [Deltaproteobacteria bacterium]|nr:hypothetical protein [Deltaproteobacteria bacterium]